jgi:glucosamine-6-phosphate deaminase
MVATQTPTRTYPVLVRVFEDADLLGKAVADNICFMVSRHRIKGYPSVLGLAAGATLKPIYDALSRSHEEGGFSFSMCHTFTLDEYYPMTPSNEKSLYHQLNKVTGTLNIHKENRHALLGNILESEIDEHCLAYERRISTLGHVGYQLLGIGQNGHIGFNEPGSLLSDRSRLVALTDDTIRDAAPNFGGKEHVPRRALTMGIGTILEAKEICLIAIGEHKASIVKRLIDSPPNSMLPASYLKTHAASCVYLDRGAAKHLRLKNDMLVMQ